MRFALFAFATLPLAFAGQAFAADPRVRIIDYDENAIVRIEGCFGFQTMVEFDPADAIENVGLGEASQWLVTPNRAANLLFVKPAYRITHSNMTVVTGRRRYGFELVTKPAAACARGEVVYRLRFRYADTAAEASTAPAVAEAPPEPAVPPPESRNTAYSFTGVAETVPQRVFDTGTQTFFHWAEGAATPAVYIRASDNSETPASFTQKGDYLVIDQVAPAFVLRRGNAVAVLFNDAYQTPALDVASPRPREQAKTETAFHWPFSRGSAAQ